MKELKYKIVKLIEIRDWNNFIKEIYQRPYNFQQQDGCKERGTYSFTVPEQYQESLEFDFENDVVPEEVNHEDRGVSFKAWLERDPTQKLKDMTYEWELELWWHRNFYPAVETIIYDLYQKKLLDV